MTLMLIKSAIMLSVTIKSIMLNITVKSIMLSVTIKSITLSVTIKSTMRNAITLIRRWLDSNPGSHGQYKSALPQCYRQWPTRVENFPNFEHPSLFRKSFQ